MITVERVSKTYRRDSLEIPVLRGIDLSISGGEFVALMGPSGSGKTTLLNLIAGLDKPTSGKITVGGLPISERRESDLAPWRARHIGFIFQLYNLIPVLTALENVELPLILTGLRRAERREHARAALTIVGLSDRLDHFPRQLSGGQEQRVAIARAIATDPLLLVADEPTGDLDAKSAREILDLLDRLNSEYGKTIVMVTHDPRAAARAHRLVHLDKGSLSESAPEAEPALAAAAVSAAAPAAAAGTLEQRFLRQVIGAMSEYADARSGGKAETPAVAPPPPAEAFEGLTPAHIVELLNRLDSLFQAEPRAEPVPTTVAAPAPPPARPRVPAGLDRLAELERMLAEDGPARAIPVERGPARDPLRSPR